MSSPWRTSALKREAIRSHDISVPKGAVLQKPDLAREKVQGCRTGRGFPEATYRRESGSGRGESGVEERRVVCVLHGRIPGGFAGSVMCPWELKLRLAPGTKARALPLKVHP